MKKLSHFQRHMLLKHAGVARSAVKYLKGKLNAKKAPISKAKQYEINKIEAQEPYTPEQGRFDWSADKRLDVPKINYYSTSGQSKRVGTHQK